MEVFWYVCVAFLQAIASSMPSQEAVALSIRLMSASTQTVGGARLASSGIEASIEPRGVVRIAPDSQSISVLESAGVTVTVWRQFGAEGNITVFYATRILASATNKALPGSDFTNVNSSFVMFDGQTVATFPVNIINDNNPEDTEQFEIILMSTEPLGLPASKNCTTAYTKSPAFDRIVHWSLRCMYSH